MFDAVLFDAGGVLVLPDPTVLGPLLVPYGAAIDVESHRRAHYAGMAEKSRAGAHEVDWAEYDRGYVEALGVPDEHAEEAAYVLGRTRHAHIWRWRIPGSTEALTALHAAGVPTTATSWGWPSPTRRSSSMRSCTSRASTGRASRTWATR
ncbi:MAG: hypothetical protein MUE78_01755 [Ilumatobacteraceae bacterium]|nr:hypothetical protein [Ilumatobacteraceae bacterium]